MTTIAFDGKFLVADTKSVDSWGLVEHCQDKILKGSDFAVGCSGDSGYILSWWKTMHKFYETKILSFDQVMDFGYPDISEKNDPNIILVKAFTGDIYRHCSGVFIPVHAKYFAVGSGRDFALAAMHCGKTAHQSVVIASLFDNNTGTELRHWEV